MLFQGFNFFYYNIHDGIALLLSQQANEPWRILVVFPERLLRRRLPPLPAAVHRHRLAKGCEALQAPHRQASSNSSNNDHQRPLLLPRRSMLLHRQHRPLRSVGRPLRRWGP